MKWLVPNLNNVVIYLGMKYSMDGASWLVGLKVGGVKILFPILVLNPIKIPGV